MTQDVVLLGAPGAGKGTQAQILQQHFGYRQVSSGDLLRRHRVSGTNLGKRAESYMQHGELVPDDLIIKMVGGELPETGALFDGFPRTVAQAEALDALVESRGRGLPLAIYFEIPRAALEERLLGRWTNPRNGRVYHATFNPPKVVSVDDEDGGPLIQREDDRPETIGRRLDVFESQTMPLIGYYAKSHRLATIDATKAVEQVTLDLRKAIHLDGGQAA